ncbi:hypothetical protein PINS_up022377 [Pythium insidiosum]|nr:hypothetical protein PINS_up006384 [Pythium insidiosum]GLE10276.1 hypothetical protein PINS_up022377 [Pythium insidiosum]
MVEIKTLQPELAALPSLKRVTLAPCMPPQSPQRVRAMQILRRIENIRIVDSVEQHGAFIYAIGVFFKSESSHIPIHIRPTAGNNAAEVDTGKGRPDLIIRHRLGEFSRLVADMKSFGVTSAVAAVLNGRRNPDSLMEWADEEPMLWRQFHHALLRRFLLELLRTVTKQAGGNDHIPVLLHEFLVSSN